MQDKNTDVGAVEPGKRGEAKKVCLLLPKITSFRKDVDFKDIIIYNIVYVGEEKVRKKRIKCAYGREIGMHRLPVSNSGS